jgi:ADP-ribosylglycohydrolase
VISAIAGDVIGSRFEFNNISNEDFGPLFADKSVYTDDTVLIVATADVILSNADYSDQYLKYAEYYPNRGYGGNFAEMVKRGCLEPYDSYGNGSAMRVSPVGWAYEGTGLISNDKAGEYNGFTYTLEMAKKSAECTHNNLEGIKGAQAIAGAIFMARKGNDKEAIKKIIEEMGYDLSKKTYDYKQGQFDVTCQGTIPRCMAVFLETENFESAMRKAVAMGGDTDTNCCIVGAICDAFYGLPEQNIIDEVYARLPKQMADVVTAFTKKYIEPEFKEPKSVGTMCSTMEDSLSSLFS